MNIVRTGIALTAVIAIFLLIVVTEPLWQKTPLPPPSTLGGNFTLNSATGPVSLTDYQGKVVVLYFGYTQCPDICPLSLAILGQAINRLSPSQQQHIQGLFISVDPERDSLQHLQQYSAFFSKHITGITGDKATLDQIVKMYGAFYRFTEMPDSAMKYAVDHSASLYLINREGQFIESVPHNIGIDTLTARLKDLL